MFRSQWPNFTHLNLTGCELDKDDLRIVFAATNPSQAGVYLPALSSLTVRPEYFEGIHDDNLFQRPWSSFAQLQLIKKSVVSNNALIGFTSISVKGFQAATLIKKGILPNLTVITLTRLSSMGLL